MGTIGQLFPLTNKTDGASVEQVQQRAIQIEDYHKSNNLHIATAKLKL
jgi:hypothetical protein